ncbi:isochorismatase family protein [bacterium]|nr:isochorismatase family protein [bacterium]
MIACIRACLAVLCVAVWTGGCTSPPEPGVPSAEKHIISFTFPDFGISGTVDELLKTVAVSFPMDVDRSHLVPIIAVSEHASVYPASGVEADFSTPQIYTVTAEDGSSAVYSVTAASDSCPALLLVDLQTIIFNVGIYNQDQLLTNVNRLITNAGSAGVPVIYILQTDDQFFVEGTSDWQLYEGVRYNGEDICINKPEPDAFFNTPLHRVLHERGVGSIYVCGLVSNGCVRETCLGGDRLGYHVMLVSDAHSVMVIDDEDVIGDISRWLSEAGMVELVRTDEVEFTP